MGAQEGRNKRFPLKALFYKASYLLPLVNVTMGNLAGIRSPSDYRSVTSIPISIKESNKDKICNAIVTTANKELLCWIMYFSHT